MGPVVGTHLGPGTTCATWFKIAERDDEDSPRALRCKGRGHQPVPLPT